ncbi:hypothetical protein ONZ45_g19229 [Pleurotus djamor]|nr:hypothetical protein ONZ45_g19229 [Pleurotus djamor]
MPSADASFYPFISWFQANGGTLDESSFGLTNFPSEEGGRGAIALQDIPDAHVLFTIPRSLTLSTKSSRLPSLFGVERWRNSSPDGFALDKGWGGLILCMMWEEANAGPWAAYLASLPSQFDTPMFWSDEELTELKGTSVVEKLGKADADREYYDKVLPAIESRKDIFFPHHLPIYYTLERFHIQGSRILSRSFTVDPPLHPAGGVEVNGHNTSSHAMDVDELGQRSDDGSNNGESEDEEESEGIVSMVPMADMLNARYKSENAKLFYEENELRMVTTKAIQAGEQIFNTYDDLPNAELLRRYGHVDLLPLSQSDGWPLPSDAPGVVALGNPGDVVELRADIVVDTVAEYILKRPSSTANAEALKEGLKNRIDWWLEAGGDDVFILELPASSLPEEVVSLVRLLVDDAEWEKAQEKEKPPKVKLDIDILAIILEALQRRLSQYDGTKEEDEKILASQSGLPLNKKHAVIVRLGEKRILSFMRDLTQQALEALTPKETASGSSRSAGVKRKGGDAQGSKGKKSRS